MIDDPHDLRPRPQSMEIAWCPIERPNFYIILFMSQRVTIVERRSGLY